MVNTTTKTKSKTLVYIVVGVVLLLLIGWWWIAGGPSRHDKQTQNDLDYIRHQVGSYVVTYKKLPTLAQLKLPSDVQARATERHYTLALEKDNSHDTGFLHQPSFDFKECADFLTNTTNTPGNTNDAHTGFQFHHNGVHCFINYANLIDSRVPPFTR